MIPKLVKLKTPIIIDIGGGFSAKILKVEPAILSAVKYLAAGDACELQSAWVDLSYAAPHGDKQRRWINLGVHQGVEAAALLAAEAHGLSPIAVLVGFKRMSEHCLVSLLDELVKRQRAKLKLTAPRAERLSAWPYASTMS